MNQHAVAGASLLVASIALACSSGSGPSGPAVSDTAAGEASSDGEASDTAADLSEVPPPGPCPDGTSTASPPAKCTTRGTGCTTADGCCVCDVFDTCGSDPVWACGSTAGAKCGPYPFLIGLDCSIEGQRCTYCNTGTLVFRTCTAGKWTDAPGFGCR